jgi:para-nitrobenzyl esterase
MDKHTNTSLNAAPRAALRHKRPHKILAFALCIAGATQAHSGPLVHLAQGDLMGISQDGVDQYRGIPYAQAPVGALRWAAPQPASPWAGQRDASRFGAACPQVPEPFADMGGNSEDCLTLNVYVPQGAPTKPRPVLLWIYGSGSVLGSGRQYDAHRLAQAMQAVVVTMNFRLGALGYLWTSGLAADRKGSNFSLQDQQAGMRWVRENIAQFQGDPKKVTIAGESIGATSVSMHLVSPTAAGLFHRAIMASGVEPPGVPTEDKAIEQGDAFALKLGCPAGPDQVACLRAKPVADLLAASPTYADLGRDGVYWHPFVDQEVVTGDVLAQVAKGRFNRVPLMMGSTLDEGRGFTTQSFHLDGTPMTQEEFVSATAKFVAKAAQPLLTQMVYTSERLGSPALAYSQVVTDAFACLNPELARRAVGQVQAYVFEFADRTVPAVVPDPFMETGAYHGADLAYWFQTPIGGYAISLSPAQIRLSDQMQRYWKRFVESGNPNEEAPANEPVWPRYNTLSTPVLTLVPDAIRTQEWGAFQRAHKCSTWSLLYALRGLGAV